MSARYGNVAHSGQLNSHADIVRSVCDGDADLRAVRGGESGETGRPLKHGCADCVTNRDVRSVLVRRS